MGSVAALCRLGVFLFSPLVVGCATPGPEEIDRAKSLCDFKFGLFRRTGSAKLAFWAKKLIFFCIFSRPENCRPTCCQGVRRRHPAGKRVDRVIDIQLQSNPTRCENYCCRGYLAQRGPAAADAGDLGKRVVPISHLRCHARSRQRLRVLSRTNIHQNAALCCTKRSVPSCTRQFQCGFSSFEAVYSRAALRGQMREQANASRV